MKISVSLAGIALAAAASFSLLSPVRAAGDEAKAPVLCAVKGEVIKDVTKAAGKAEFNGKEYLFCCAGCKATFAADPAKFAKLTDLRTDKIVLERKVNSLNSEIKTLEATPTKKAAAAPAASAAAAAKPVLLFCAITDEEIESVAKSAGKATFKGKDYYFCCGGCITKFNEDPAKFAAEADARMAKHTASAATAK